MYTFIFKDESFEGWHLYTGSRFNYEMILKDAEKLIAEGKATEYIVETFINDSDWITLSGLVYDANCGDGQAQDILGIIDYY